MNRKRLQTLAGMLNENTMFIGSGIFEPTPVGGVYKSPFTGADHEERDVYMSGTPMHPDDYEDMHSMHTYGQDSHAVLFEGEEDEIGMVKTDVGIMLEDLKDLYDMLCHLHQSGQDVNFPHWWQSKLILAKDYIGKAADYLDQEMQH